MVDRELQAGAALDQQSEGHVCARVMKAVGKMMQVKRPRRALIRSAVTAGVECNNLRLQIIEKPGEAPVVTVPGDDRTNHNVIPPESSRATRGVANNFIIVQRSCAPLDWSKFGDFCGRQET